MSRFPGQTKEQLEEMLIRRNHHLAAIISAFEWSGGQLSARHQALQQAIQDADRDIMGESRL